MFYDSGRYARLGCCNHNFSAVASYGLLAHGLVGFLVAVSSIPGSVSAKKLHSLIRSKKWTNDMTNGE